MKKYILIYIVCSFPFLSSLLAFGQNLSTDELTGQWKFNVIIDGLGEISLLVNIKKTSDSTFTASSRHNAMKEIIGGSKQFMANLFVKQYKKGAFVRVFKGKIKDDRLSGIFTAPGVGMYLNATIENGKITGTLGDDKLGNNKKVNNPFIAVPYNSEKIDYDYSALSKKIKETFRQHIFNPQILDEKEWRTFFKNLDDMVPFVRDDLEFFVGFTNLCQKVNISHIGILKSNPWNSIEDNLKMLVETKMLNSNAAYIKFKGFALADTLIVRNFFDSIIKQNIPNLVIDMRECSGGDYSSMFLASYLIKDPLDAGFFIGNNYFKENTNLPDDAVLRKAPVYNGNSLKDFLQAIIDNGLLAGRVVPDKKLHYSGKVFALTDNYSASATEPIAYFFKQHNLAILVGEKTAGDMLSSTFIDIQNSWVLVVPTADYYTADRFRIEGNGVKPTIKVKSEKALEYVLDKIITQ